MESPQKNIADCMVPALHSYRNDLRNVGLNMHSLMCFIPKLLVIHQKLSNYKSSTEIGFAPRLQLKALHNKFTWSL